MEGFTNVFTVCEQNKKSEDIKNFRESPTYAFAFQNGPPDNNAINLMFNINPEYYKHFISVPKGKFGYTPNVTYYPVDVCDSRHMMMSSIILQKSDSYPHIVEIGGGYGNWTRLNQNIMKYNKWTIIDLPYVLDLQKEYLASENVDMTKMEFVSAYDYKTWTDDEKQFDLVIGAHSLSELSWDNFMEYFDNVLLKTNYLFYATHLTNCGEQLLTAKINKLMEEFDIISEYATERNMVKNILFLRRSPI
jgi:hypothetical protein